MCLCDNLLGVWMLRTQILKTILIPCHSAQPIHRLPANPHTRNSRNLFVLESRFRQHFRIVQNKTMSVSYSQFSFFSIWYYWITTIRRMLFKMDIFLVQKMDLLAISHPIVLYTIKITTFSWIAIDKERRKAKSKEKSDDKIDWVSKYIHGLS